MNQDVLASYDNPSRNPGEPSLREPSISQSCSDKETRSRDLVYLLLLLCFCGSLYLLKAGSMPLSDPDEARCGLIVQEMIASGDWIAPHLRGQLYTDKPAPFFWLAALGTEITGNAELGGRLFPALSGVLAVLLTYLFARSLFDSRIALLAGLMLGTGGEFIYVARWYRMDMPFVAAMWAAIWWFWRCEKQRPSHPQGKSPWQWYGLYFFCAIATAFKGPAGAGLPGLVILAYLLLLGRPRRLLGLFHPGAILLYFLVAAPWYVMMERHHPGYLNSFLIHQNVDRYANADMGRKWPGIAYLGILIMGFFPWSVYLPGAFVCYFPRRWKERAKNPGVMLLWLAALVPLLFFMLGKTRLANYIMPVFPPLAILMAALLGEWVQCKRPDRLLREGGRWFAGCVLFMPAVGIGVEAFIHRWDYWLILPCVLSLLIALKMFGCLRSDRRGSFLAWGIAGIALNLLFVFGYVVPTGFEAMSTRNLVRAAQAEKLRGSYICFLPKLQYSYYFYSGATQGDSFGDNPEDWQSLHDLIDSDWPVFCLVNGADRLQKLQANCPGRLRVVAKSNSRWLVTNCPAEAGTTKEAGSTP